MPDPAPAAPLTVAAETVTVNGARVRPTSPAWLGLDLSRAVVREHSTLMMAVLGAAAPPDHHLDVPFCHPADQPEGWDDGLRYRVRPRRKGWRFVQRGGVWMMEPPR